MKNQSLFSHNYMKTKSNIALLGALAFGILIGPLCQSTEDCINDCTKEGRSNCRLECDDDCDPPDCPSSPMSESEATNSDGGQGGV